LEQKERSVLMVAWEGTDIGMIDESGNVMSVMSKTVNLEGLRLILEKRSQSLKIVEMDSEEVELSHPGSKITAMRHPHLETAGVLVIK
jgi:hypothetical protein